MCGIVAVWRREGAPVSADEVVAMRDLLAHRGPDDAGAFVAGSVGLGHRRLRIIDLEGGHQPMANARGTVHVVFNGEIYNYLELREMLTARGQRLRTRSDTETILGLYDLYGSACVEHLRGMFAFVLWDAERRRLIAARDRLGIKPLYMLRDGRTVAFASEPKAFLGVRGFTPALRDEAVAEYLIYRHLAMGRTMLRGVEGVQAGEILELTEDGERRRRYWSLPQPSEAPPTRPEGEWVDELESLLRPVVRQHMLSDVPVGAFLSGGVDSSIVTALAAGVPGPRLHTFSVGFEEPEFDERAYAQAVADRLGTLHTSLVVSQREYAEWLPDAVWHADEPLGHPHVVHIHYLSRLARERVTVVLTGEGSDELFAGYPRYRALGILDRAPRLSRQLAAVLAPLARLLPGRPGMRVRAILDGGKDIRIDGLATFVDAAEIRSVAPGLPGPGPRSVGAPSDAGLLARALLLDQQTYLEALLHRMDRMTMSVGLEARVPFLDHEVVELAARVPLSLKLHGLETKRVVKELARRFVPASVIDRPKKGFGVPIARWLRPGGALAQHLDLVLSSNARIRTYVDGRRVEALATAHRAGKKDHSELLWGLLNLELWHRVLLERAVPPAADERNAAMRSGSRRWAL